MASTNQSPFYKKAEQEFHQATTDEEKIKCLEIMIKEAPKHKSSENMLRNLKTRLKKLKSNLSKSKKKKSSQRGIKKADIQCVLVGLPNTGKSTIFKTLTNLNPKISPHPFTTYKPQLGTFNFEDTKIQIIDDAPFPNQNKSLINSVDTLLIVINSPSQIEEVEKQIWKSPAKKIYIFNKTDLLNEKELRKLKETINSKHKKINTFYINKNSPSTETNSLKKKIFETFPIIRIYTKESKNPPGKKPMILKQNSTIEDAAEKILKGMSKKVKRAKIWGPSSKFSGQITGLNHILKDKDIIELQTK